MKSLRFTPECWAKLLYLRDYGDTEIGGYGLAGTDDPLLITDIFVPLQECTEYSVEFDGDSLIELVDSELDPDHSLRVWIHTHPDIGASPSGTDEKTFKELLGGAPWSVMFILAKGGETYCRAQYGIGPGGSLEIPVEIAWDSIQNEDWEQVYSENVIDITETPSQSDEFAQWHEIHKQSMETCLPFGSSESKLDDDTFQTSDYCPDCNIWWEVEDLYGDPECVKCGGNLL